MKKPWAIWYLGEPEKAANPPDGSKSSDWAPGWLEDGTLRFATEAEARADLARIDDEGDDDSPNSCYVPRLFTRTP